MNQRYFDLEHQWAQLRERIAGAAARSGRTASDLTAIAVTKTFPTTDVEHLIALGFRNFGENRVSELKTKAAHDYAQPVTWHMVGQLQTNKVNHAVRSSDVIHSCDRERLVDALERAAVNQQKQLGVLIQVRLDADPNRGGVAPADVLDLAEKVAATSSLTLRGVMAMAPREGDPARAFNRLQQISEQLCADHPGANWISAGMSEDFEDAIEHGATHLRLGRGLLGTRPYVG